MNSYPFSEALAHPGDPLTNHLERTAHEAKKSVAGMPEAVEVQAVFAGLCHDLGKATRFFQKLRLGDNRRTKKTVHSFLSGLISWWLGRGLCPEDEKDDLRIRLNVLCAILRHHGDLRTNRIDMLASFREYCVNEHDLLAGQLCSIDLAGMADWFSRAAKQFSLPWASFWGTSFFDGPRDPDEIIDSIKKPNRFVIEEKLENPASGALADMLEFLSIYGALLSADKIDTALEGDKIKRGRLYPGLVANYKKIKFKDTTDTSAPDSMLELRREISGNVVENIKKPNKHQIFTLTAPTGSGKTLTVLDAALCLREKIFERTGISPRIIYCLPFTSIIDQNHQVFSDVLDKGGIMPGSDILLKHHYLTSPMFRVFGQNREIPESEYEPDGAGQLLTETWQSEIVVTTFHQLLNTFFTGRNRNLKRFAQLAGAIVILDEVQAVPLRYWRAIGRLFSAASRTLHTRFILMTATQPLIFSPEEKTTELLSCHERYFQKLSRMSIRCHHTEKTTLSDFIERILEDYLENPRPVLVIVNRKKAVAMLHERLKSEVGNDPVLALSTNLTPKDRKQRIKEIQEATKSGRPVIVVSTQIVEAGVDLSFPVVHRDMAPLDSIIQSCGRCNRNSEAPKGILHLWQLVDDGEAGGEKPLWRNIYDKTLIQVTGEILNDKSVIGEEEFVRLSGRYFALCRERGEPVKLEKLLTAGDFAELAVEFKLIDDQGPTVTVFIIRNDGDRALWEEYRSLNEIDSPIERRRRFSTIKFEFLERVIQVRAGRHYEDKVLAVCADDGYYNKETGLTGLPEDEGTSWCMI